MNITFSAIRDRASARKFIELHPDLFLPNSRAKEEIKRWKGFQRLFIFTVLDKPIAWVLASNHEQPKTILNIFVHPAFRRQGIGSKALHSVVEKLSTNPTLPRKDGHLLFDSFPHDYPSQQFFAAIFTDDPAEAT